MRQTRSRPDSTHVPGPNRLSRKRAITLEHGDYAGLGGRCQLRDRGAMSKGWCDEWEAVAPGEERVTGTRAQTATFTMF